MKYDLDADKYGYGKLKKSLLSFKLNEINVEEEDYECSPWIIYLFD